MTTRPPRTREAVASTSDEAPSQRANGAGTARYRDRFAPGFAADYFRAAPLHTTVSSIGIGTYLGEPTATDDEAYVASVEHAVRSGINVIDTALNYRGQRSERAVGAALRRLTASGDVSRDEVVLCSKGGYIPLDGQPPASRDEYLAYVKREFIDTEILRPGGDRRRRAQPRAAFHQVLSRQEPPEPRRAVHRRVLPAQPRTAGGRRRSRRAAGSNPLGVFDSRGRRVTRGESASTAAPPGTASARPPTPRTISSSRSWSDWRATRAERTIIFARFRCRSTSRCPRRFGFRRRRYGEKLSRRPRPRRRSI